MFSEKLKVILETKLFQKFSPNIEHGFKITLSKKLKLPIIPINIEELKQMVGLKNNIELFHFFPNKLELLLEFNGRQQLGLKINYNRENKTKGIIEINNSLYYLDDLWCHSFFNSQKFIFIIIACCPLAYFLEIARIKLRFDNYFGQIFNSLKETVLHFFKVEKKYSQENTIYLNLPIKRELGINYLNGISNEISVKMFEILSLSYFEKIIDEIKFQEAEYQYLIDILQKEILRSIHPKSYLKNLEAEIIIQFLINLLILDFFSQDSEIYSEISKLFNIDEIKEFIKTGREIIQKFEKGKYNYDNILDLVNLLFNYTNKLEKS